VPGPVGQRHGELEQRLDVVTGRPVRRAHLPCLVEVGDGVIEQSQMPGRDAQVELNRPQVARGARPTRDMVTAVTGQ
jgi:hypothetical protein